MKDVRRKSWNNNLWNIAKIEYELIEKGYEGFIMISLKTEFGNFQKGIFCEI